MDEIKRVIRTKAQWETKFREDNPTIVRGVNDEIETLTEAEYEALITLWTENAFKGQEDALKAEADEIAKAAEKQALLNKLGITENEAKLLLS